MDHIIKLSLNARLNGMVVRRPLPTIQHIMCIINIVSKFVADVILVYQQSGSKCLRNGKDGLIRNHPFRYTINYEKAVITIGVNIVQLQKYLTYKTILYNFRI